MKSVFWISMLAVMASSCGDGGIPGAASTMVGATFEASVQSADADLVTKVSSVCQALRSKETLFRQNFLSAGTKFNFEVEQINCEAKKVKSAVQTRLAMSAGNLQWEVVTGDYFVSNLETGTVGTMSQLCNNLNNLTQPQMVGSQIALRYNVVNCGQDSCLTVETGVKQASGQFRVSKADIFQIDMSNSSTLGMVKNHQHQNADVCDGNKAFINVANFVNISN